MIFDPENPVFQKDLTGCALACTAWISGHDYDAVKTRASELNISIEDPDLWSNQTNIRTLLQSYDVTLAAKEAAFTDWDRLPDRALLAVKWHLEKGIPHWHWVVFSRTEKGSLVMDPKKVLKTNIRTDFGRIKPKWFITLR